MKHNNFPLHKKTLLYEIFGHAFTVGDLLDKAARDGERNIHIITTYTPVRAHPNDTIHTEIAIDVEYSHLNKTHRVNAYRVSPNSENYKTEQHIKEIRETIEATGINLRTKFNITTLEEKISLSP